MKWVSSKFVALCVRIVRERSYHIQQTPEAKRRVYKNGPMNSDRDEEEVNIKTQAKARIENIDFSKRVCTICSIIHQGWDTMIYIGLG